MLEKIKFGVKGDSYLILKLNEMIDKINELEKKIEELSNKTGGLTTYGKPSGGGNMFGNGRRWWKG